MNKRNPIKRHKAIQPFSREHHHGLLLCWKIKTGFSSKISDERIRGYAYWFYQNNLLQHFDSEERLIFPILGNEHKYVEKALSEHHHLTYLFENRREVHESLKKISEELQSHIRFEEQVLFNEIQKIANEVTLQQIEEAHNSILFCEDWEDKFWEITTNRS